MYTGTVPSPNTFWSKGFVRLFEGMKLGFTFKIVIVQPLLDYQQKQQLSSRDRVQDMPFIANVRHPSPADFKNFSILSILWNVHSFQSPGKWLKKPCIFIFKSAYWELSRFRWTPQKITEQCSHTKQCPTDQDSPMTKNKPQSYSEPPPKPPMFYGYFAFWMKNHIFSCEQIFFWVHWVWNFVRFNFFIHSFMAADPFFISPDNVCHKSCWNTVDILKGGSTWNKSSGLSSLIKAANLHREAFRWCWKPASAVFWLYLYCHSICICVRIL